MSSPLTAATLRNLGQKEYDKRKQAALEVENLARELRDASEFEKVAGLIQTLSTDLAESPLANLRKGALHALVRGGGVRDRRGGIEGRVGHAERTEHLSTEGGGASW